MTTLSLRPTYRCGWCGWVTRLWQPPTDGCPSRSNRLHQWRSLSASTSREPPSSLPDANGHPKP